MVHCFPIHRPSTCPTHVAVRHAQVAFGSYWSAEVCLQMRCLVSARVAVPEGDDIVHDPGRAGVGGNGRRQGALREQTGVEERGNDRACADDVGSGWPFSTTVFSPNFYFSMVWNQDPTWRFCRALRSEDVRPSHCKFTGKISVRTPSGTHVENFHSFVCCWSAKLLCDVHCHSLSSLIAEDFGREEETREQIEIDDKRRKSRFANRSVT